MKRQILPLFLAAFLSGCAAYKELEPEPPVMPAERFVTWRTPNELMIRLQVNGLVNLLGVNRHALQLAVP